MSNIICAVDPGNVKSAYVIYDCEARIPLVKEKCANDKLATIICNGESGHVLRFDTLVIEYPRPRGQPMYHQLVDTIFWCGRFVETYGHDDYWLIDRKDVKMHFIGTTTAKDSNIRMACINKFSNASNLGGGKCPEIGNKKQPGPLHGFANDTWQALGIAIAYAEGGLKNINPQAEEVEKQQSKASTSATFLC